MTELSWKHQTLIQALLSRGPLTEVEFHQVFNGITGKSAVTNQQVFDDYLLKINKALSYVQFELRCCRNQYDGSVYYGIVNNISDEQSKMGTKYSVPQIVFYKAMIEAIVLNTTAQGSISNIFALNLQLESQLPEAASESQGGCCAALRNFSLSQKEKAIEDFINDQWLKRTPDDKIALGMRSFLDLRSWFRNNDVPSCEACNEAGVKAELCENEDCTARIHLYCLKKFFAKRKGGRVCPRCKTEWKFHGPDEEVVVKDENKEPIASAPVPSDRKGKRPRTDTIAECNSQGGDSLQRRRVTRSYAHAR